MNIEIESLSGSDDFFCTVTRTKFEELCLPLFQEIIPIVEKAIQDSGFAKHQIQDVILVGGSTRIPKIIQLLTDFFKGKELNRSVNPDEAVAYGAAIQAAIMTGQKSEKLNNILVLDASPLSIGYETAGGIMTTVIKKDTTVPAKKDQILTTTMDNQLSLLVQLFEGEKNFIKDNHLLGQLHLLGIPPMPKGVPQIELALHFDANAILNAKAVEKSAGKNITVVIDKGRLSNEEIEEMVKEAEIHNNEDKLQKKKLDMKNKLEEYCYLIRSTITDEKLADKINDSERPQLDEMSQATLTWIDNNIKGEVKDYERKLKELESVFGPIKSRFSKF